MRANQSQLPEWGLWRGGCGLTNGISCPLLSFRVGILLVAIVDGVVDEESLGKKATDTCRECLKRMRRAVDIHTE